MLNSLTDLLTFALDRAGGLTMRLTNRPVVGASVAVAVAAWLAFCGGAVTSATAATQPARNASVATALAADTDSDPSLATMNKARDHAMGSTVPIYEPPSALASSGLRAFSVQANSVPPGVHGLDVSGWQTSVNWSQVWSDGGRFAYVKATESTDYTSSQFTKQYNGSSAAGLIRGAYHFAIPNASSGAAQANFFLANGGGWTADGKTLPPLLDIEYNPYTATDGTNTCYGLSASQMVAWINEFTSTVHAATGVLPAIYTTTGWWSTCTGNSASFAQNPLFIARYPTNVADGPGTLPAGWSRYSMWQFADAGIFPGDQDVFNGTYAALQAFASAGLAMPQPVVGGSDFNGDSKPDLLARKPDGTLWFYAGTGSMSAGASYLPGVQVGIGWEMFNQVIPGGDFNGDGKPDLLARKPDGTLWLYPGTANPFSASGAFGVGVQIGTSWDIFNTIIAAGDVNGDGRPDLLGRKPDGALLLYAGTGKSGASDSGLLPGVQVGTGWGIFQQIVGVGDLNHDGRDDLVGMRSDGSLWLYRGTASTWYPGVRMNAPTLNSTDLLISGGDANGDDIPDLLTRSTDGILHFLAGAVGPQLAFGEAQLVGSGWQVFVDVVGAGDLDGNRTPDIVAVGDDGTLWFYSGIGSSGGTNRSYLAGRKIGYGWSVFDKVIDAGDFNGDGARDLIGVRQDGTLWLYPGLGTVSATGVAYGSGVQIGTGWGVFTQIVAGDFNHDGQMDLLAVKSGGSALLYPGALEATGTWFAKPVSAGTRWGSFDLVIGTTDSNGDDLSDVLARSVKDGSLWFLAGSRDDGVLTSATQVGTAWQVYTSLTNTGDVAAGRGGDLLGVKSNGTLWYYPGTEMAGIPGGAYSPEVAVGSGWNIFG